MIPPVVGLGLEIFEVVEGSQGQEVVPDIVDGTLFHFAFLMGLADVAGPGDNPEGTKEFQKPLVEAHKRSLPLHHSGAHVVMDELAWGSLKKEKSMEKAAVKGLLSLRVGELQIEQAAVALNDRQAVELALGITVDNGAEMAPIDLALLPRQ
jgi:hypothetical protein